MPIAKRMKPLMGEGKKSTWGTPWSFFRMIDKEFNFLLDVCAEPKTAKVKSCYFTREENSFKQNWAEVAKERWEATPGNVYSGYDGGEDLTAWCNPPYGPVIDQWLIKGWEEAQRGLTTVYLLPARTDVKWFHMFGPEGELRFVKGRITFQGASHGATFPSLLLILGPRAEVGAVKYMSNGR